MVAIAILWVLIDVYIAPAGYLLVELGEQVGGLGSNHWYLDRGEIVVNLCRYLDVVMNGLGVVQCCLISGETLLEFADVLAVLAGHLNVIAEFCEFSCPNVRNGLDVENSDFLQLRVDLVDKLGKVFWSAGCAEEL